ncbi:MAG TPA: hypothetical protein VHN37_14170 [Actinomycetota bacterium]|nr:hypothetical protein [Actinomycetota bacterium]
MVESVLEQGSRAPVGPALQAALRLIEGFTLRPEDLSVDDVDAAREAGLSDLAIEHVFYVAALWNVFGRLADAFGFEVYEDEVFLKGAPLVLRLGYRFPAPLWLRA